MLIETLFQAMARREGWTSADPQARPRRNNNPLNLVFAGQPFARKEENGPFAVFDCPGRGIAAAYRQLAKWIESGLTLNELITTQAPPNENDTQAYIACVALDLEALTALRPFPADAPLLSFLG